METKKTNGGGWISTSHLEFLPRVNLKKKSQDTDQVYENKTPNCQPSIIAMNKCTECRILMVYWHLNVLAGRIPKRSAIKIRMNMFIKSDDIQIRTEDYHAQSTQKRFLNFFLYNNSKKTKIRQLWNQL